MNNDRRGKFITAQVLDVASSPQWVKYGGVHFDEENLDWVMFPKYPLPQRWADRWTSLLILFPAGYPDTPPLGFYLTANRALKGGAKDSHFFAGQPAHDQPDLTGQGWHWYCAYPDANGPGCWTPSNNPSAPDNLFTLLTLVREVLSSDT